MKRPRQLSLSFEKPKRRARPGKRLGRPPKGQRAGVSHLKREALDPRHPVHVTLKTLQHVGKLRSRTLYPVIERSIRLAKERLGARLVHFSVQDDHIHLIVEAEGKKRLARAIQGLCIRIGKQLNRARGTRGKVFADRFHSRVLKNPTTVYNAVAYVLTNAQKHGYQAPTPEQGIDHRSSGAWFQGWTEKRSGTARSLEPPVAAPRTWLLREGWRRVGTIPVYREARCPW